MSSSKMKLYLLLVGFMIGSLGLVTEPLAFAKPFGGAQITSVAVGTPATNSSAGEDNGSSSIQNSEAASAEAQNFDANGTINAVTYITKFLKYDLQGVWSMQVRDGNTVQFEANIAAVPSSKELGKSHTHQLLNFEPSEVGLRDSSNNFFTNGTLDIGTNDGITWTAVPVVISINDGSSITITIDDSQAGHHFAGQPIVGTVESIIDCSAVPGAAMSIESVCQAGVSNNVIGEEEAGDRNSTSNDQITVTIDSETYAPNETPQISGTVSNPVTGTLVQVDVSDSTGQIVYNTVAGLGTDGNFQTGLKTFSPGNYNVVVTYHGNTASTNFEVIQP